MAWHEGRLTAFDVETTGPDPTGARIVTAAVTAMGGGLLDEPHSWLVDPGVEIPEGAIAVHGISNEVARERGMAADRAVAEILDRLSESLVTGFPIVAYNARFDMTVLDREARRYGLTPLEERCGGPDRIVVIDPYVIDKRIDRYRKGKRTLTATCEHYGVVLADAHTADADAAAAVELARCLAEHDEELRALEPQQLHASQVEWAAEQARSLQEYFDRQGRAERVEPAWPIIPALQPA